MIRLCAFLAVVAGLFVVVGQGRQNDPSSLNRRRLPEDRWWRRGAQAVPRHARVSLLLDKDQYFLGENVLVHFCVENRGSDTFSINLGGDYRCASRHLRFSVQATDEQGRPVPDPDPSGYCMGGLISSLDLAPGERHYESLPLMRYCRFEKPGVYRLRVSHDLGWSEAGGRKIPVAETTITLLMPNQEQARKVVEETYRLPNELGRSGVRREPYPDFSTLAYPVYLPILAPRAAEGDERALEALGHISTPDATAALIRLLDHPDLRFARRVTQTLDLRLPDPQLEGKLDKRNVFEDTQEDHRRWLAGRSWRAEFAPAVRKVGRRLLAGEDTEGLQCGAFILECLGEEEDLPALLRSLDRAAARAMDQPLEKNVYPRPRGACQELLRAVRMMSLRGIQPPASPRSAGEMILFASTIGTQPQFRPAGWEPTYARILQANLPYVREVALENLPLPPPPSLLALLPKLLADPNVDVQIVACHVAAKTRAPQLREPVLKVLASAREDWLLNAAGNAAWVLATRMDRIRVWVERLDEEGMTAICLDHLASEVLAGRHGGSYLIRDMLDVAAGRACKAAWLEFLRNHGEELQAGKKFPATDPALPVRELFPKLRLGPPG